MARAPAGAVIALSTPGPVREREPARMGAGGPP